MAEISLEGERFYLTLDDGRRVVVLDANDNCANATGRSMLQELLVGDDVFGRQASSPRPLLLDIVDAMQMFAAAQDGGIVADITAGLLLLRGFLAAPHASRLLAVGPSVDTRVLRFAKTLFDAVAAPGRGVAVTAAAPLGDDAAPLADTLPLRTDLARLLLPSGAFDQLLLDARGLDLPHEAARRFADALAPGGCVVFLGARPQAPQLVRRTEYPFSGMGSVVCGWRADAAPAPSPDARLCAERAAAGRRLHAFLAGTADAVATLDGVQQYGRTLIGLADHVRWRGERACVARARDLLVDIRLGQESAEARETLHAIAQRFLSSLHVS